MKYIRLLLWIAMFFTSQAFAVYPAPVTGKNGMVVSSHYLATEVGESILKKGGNAIDAAVAMGYALAVVEPCCGNIGGGGFMLIHLADGKNIFLNFREKAPLAARADMFLDKQGKVIPKKATEGYLAVAVPGTVMGFETALNKYGTLPRQQLIAPAIQLAEKGFKLTESDIAMLNSEKKYFQNVPEIFTKNYQAGDRLTQKNLANTLKEISAKGNEAFYQGSIAQAIVEESQKQGGILSLDDFTRYNVEELTPVECQYRDYAVFSAPPPSSGGVTLCEMLNILEGYPLQDYGFHSAQSSHYIIEAMRFGFADRNNHLGDPNFVNNPVTQLTSKDYASKIRQLILPDYMTPSEKIFSQSIHEGENTTHYSVVDHFGNAVSVTYTLNSFFGAKVIAGNTGFFLNNEMDDFSIKKGSSNQFGLVQGSKNRIEPGKRPLSSMAPTILLKDNKLAMVLGSPGGPRIITSVLETILNVIDYEMDIKAAVDSPRFHHQFLPDVVEAEPFTFSEDTLQKLKTMGYTFKEHQPWGAIEAILVANGVFNGGSDDRRPNGKALGLK